MKNIDFLLVAATVLAVGCAARAQPVADESGDFALTAMAVDGQGKHVNAAFHFWKAVASAGEKADPWAHGNGPQRWRDARDGTTWELFHSFGAIFEATVDKLSPGDYRVTATAARGLTPIGFSRPIRLRDGGNFKNRCTVEMKEGPSLEVRAVQAVSGSVVAGFQALLVREDGLPVASWSSSPWAVWSKEEAASVKYASLEPGNYTLHVRRPAFRFGDEPLRSAIRPIHVTVASGKDERLTVRMEPDPLPEAVVRERWPFAVTGRVVDELGKGMAGVGVTAHCGMGTLFATGTATTDASGQYLLRFGPGMRVKREGGWGVGVQAATISPAKEGFAEANLHRQGDLLMADRLPGPQEDVGWKVDAARVVVPDKPYQLDFKMVRAGSIKGRLVDDGNRPLSGRKIYLTGPELPPSSSVLAGAEADQDGYFGLANVPTGRQWEFYLAEDSKVKTSRFTIASPEPEVMTLRVTTEGGKRVLLLERSQAR